MKTRRGWTLIELSFATLLMGIIGSVVSGLLHSAPRQTNALVLASETRRSSAQARELISAHLRDAAVSQLSLVHGAGEALELRFRKARISHDDGTVSLGPELKLGFAYSGNDPLNGVDDDGNGLIDDGVLYLIHGDGNQQILLSFVLPGSFRLGLPSAGQRALSLRFQVARRRSPGANYQQSPDGRGVYPEQKGFALGSVAEVLALRN